MAIELDKIIFRGKNTYEKMYKGTELIAQIKSPEPELDYFYIQPLSDVSWNLKDNSVLKRNEDIFEYKIDNGTWKKFSSIPREGDFTRMSDWMVANPTYLVAVVPETITNQINIFQWGGGAGTDSWPGVKATLLGNDGNGNNIYVRDIGTETWGNMIVNQSTGSPQSRNLNNVQHTQVAVWNGSGNSGSLGNASDYSYGELTYDDVDIEANKKFYIRCTDSYTGGNGNKFSEGFNSSFNIGGNTSYLGDFSHESMFSFNQMVVDVNNLVVTHNNCDRMFQGCTSLNNFNIEIGNTINDTIINYFLRYSKMNSINVKIHGQCVSSIFRPFEFSNTCTADGTIEFLDNITFARKDDYTESTLYQLGRYGNNITLKIPYGSALPKNLSGVAYWHVSPYANFDFEFVDRNWNIEYTGNDDNLFGLRMIGSSYVKFRLKKNTSSSSSYPTVKYSKDRENWYEVVFTEYDGSGGKVYEINGQGDSIYFKTVNNTTFNGSLKFVEDEVGESTYTYRNRYSVFGNISQLSDKDATYSINAFKVTSLFQDCLYLYSANNLNLDATKGEQFGGRYNSMFRGCTNLFIAIDKLRGKYSKSDFAYMYYGCTRLTRASDIHSELNTDTCVDLTYTFNQTYQNCTSLLSTFNYYETIKLSGLTDKASRVFSQTFYGCTSLKSTMSEIYYSSDITSATTGTYNILNSTFRNDTSLACAPRIISELPIKTSASYTFYGCYNLEWVYRKNVNNTFSLGESSWLDGVKSTGTAYLINYNNVSSRGVNTIPSGWTINYTD